MATARVHYSEDNPVVAQNISIPGSLTPSPAACIITGSQPVVFTNNSGSNVSVTFVPNAVNPASRVFNDFTLTASAPGNTNTQTPQVANGAVNYYVGSGGGNVGPFAIQVGAGPMQLSVVYNGTASVCTPDPIAIPLGGTLQFNAGDSNNYAVAWTTADPFTPLITQFGSGNPVQSTETDPKGDYKYTVNRLQIIDGTGNGGGTVKVKS